MSDASSKRRSRVADAAVSVLVDGARGLDAGERLRVALARGGLTDVELWANGHEGILARLESIQLMLVLVGTDAFAREVLDAIEHAPPPALRREAHGANWAGYQLTVLISTDPAAQDAAQSSRHPHVHAAHGNMDRVAVDLLLGDELTLAEVPLSQRLNAIRDRQSEKSAVQPGDRDCDESALVTVHETVRGPGGTWLP